LEKRNKNPQRKTYLSNNEGKKKGEEASGGFGVMSKIRRKNSMRNTRQGGQTSSKKESPFNIWRTGGKPNLSKPSAKNEENQIPAEYVVQKKEAV